MNKAPAGAAMPLARRVIIINAQIHFGVGFEAFNEQAFRSCGAFASVRIGEKFMARKITKPANLPSGAGELARRHPEIWESYAELGKRCADAGPLDARARRLVKIALAAGAGLEGAVHSHVRRGLAEGLAADQIRHIALLAVTTLGLPGAVRTKTWIDDVLAVRPAKRSERKKR